MSWWNFHSFFAWKSIVSFCGVFTLSLLNSCGNGEPVGITAPPPIIYYSIDANAVCPNNVAYQSSISVVDSKIFLIDNCNGSSQEISVSEIELSSVFSLLGYQAAIYEKRTLPPKPNDAVEIYTQVFCLSASGVKDVEFKVITGPGLAKPSGTLAQKQGSAWTTSTAEVGITTVGTQQTIQASEFTLEIDLGSASFAPYRFPATLQVQGEGSTRPMACRVLN